MTKYLVERYLPGMTPEQLAAAAGSAKRNTTTMTQEGTPVQYLRSTFIPGEETCSWWDRPRRWGEPPTTGPNSPTSASSRRCTSPQTTSGSGEAEGIDQGRAAIVVETPRSAHRISQTMRTAGTFRSTDRTVWASILHRRVFADSAGGLGYRRLPYRE